MIEDFTITAVDIFPIAPTGNLCAFASVQFNNILRINSIGVKIGTNGGIYITLPAKRVGAGLQLYVTVPKELKERIRVAVAQKVQESGLFAYKISKNDQENETIKKS